MLCFSFDPILLMRIGYLAKEERENGTIEQKG